MNGRDLGDIYDESNHRIYSKSNIISDVDIRITTERKAYSVKLIIINNESEIAVDERITSHIDDSCSFDLNAILGTDKFKVVRQYHYPTNINDKYMPTIVYNDESRTLRITDLKCDLTFYYLVEYTD